MGVKVRLQRRVRQRMNNLPPGMEMARLSGGSVTVAAAPETHEDATTVEL
jgi:hypothetical protein